MTHTFGDRVSVTQRLVRRAEYHGGSARRKVWKPEKIVQRSAVGSQMTLKTTDSPASGVIIGKRILANGETSWGGIGEPIIFTAEERFSAYLIAVDLRSAPFYVLPEHIIPRPAETEFEVGQAVERTDVETSGAGIVISTEISDGDGGHDPVVAVLWGEDDNGWMIDEWELPDDPPPLRTASRPAAEVTRLLVDAVRENEL